MVHKVKNFPVYFNIYRVLDHVFTVCQFIFSHLKSWYWLAQSSTILLNTALLSSCTHKLPSCHTDSPYMNAIYDAGLLWAPVWLYCLLASQPRFYTNCISRVVLLVQSWKTRHTEFVEVARIGRMSEDFERHVHATMWPSLLPPLPAISVPEYVFKKQSECLISSYNSVLKEIVLVLDFRLSHGVQWTQLYDVKSLKHKRSKETVVLNCCNTD